MELSTPIQKEKGQRKYSVPNLLISLSHRVQCTIAELSSELVLGVFSSRNEVAARVAFRLIICYLTFLAFVVADVRLVLRDRREI